MYCAPSVVRPSVQDIKECSESLGFGIGDDELKEYTEIVSANCEKYTKLKDYPDLMLPVKYPRTPGYRPSKEENKYNAWYYKTDIKGAADGSLKGKTVAIKDNVPLAGVPMMQGSVIVEGYVPDYDATIVTRILDAGGHIVGKAVCEDYCCSGNSFTAHYGPVLNPVDPTRGSGGSSSGCAVVVKTGEADVAIVNDVAGSTRIPASFCGIVGMKPTYGLVPCTGIPSMAPSLDHWGILAGNVTNCALLLEAIAGFDDGRDFRQHPGMEIPKYSQLLTGEVTDLKIGLLKEGFEFSGSNIAKIVRDAARKITTKAATVEEMSIPMHKDSPALCGPLLYESVYHTHNIGTGWPVGPQSYYATSSAENFYSFQKAKAKQFSPTAKMFQLTGKYIHDNYGMKFYAKSQNLALVLKDKYNEALKKYDVIILPTLPYSAKKLPEANIDLKGYVSSALGTVTLNTVQTCATGHPAISINAGFEDELPVGMMIVGGLHDDATVLNVAYAFEQLGVGKK